MRWPVAIVLIHGRPVNEFTQYSNFERRDGYQTWQLRSQMLIYNLIFSLTYPSTDIRWLNVNIYFRDSLRAFTLLLGWRFLPNCLIIGTTQYPLLVIYTTLIHYPQQAFHILKCFINYYVSAALKNLCMQLVSPSSWLIPWKNAPDGLRRSFLTSLKFEVILLQLPLTRTWQWVVWLLLLMVMAYGEWYCWANSIHLW